MTKIATVSRALIGASTLALVAQAGAQPANDDCANAISVSLGSVIGGSNAGATGVDLTTGCGTSDTTDVWFSFTAPDATTVYATTCGPGSLDSTVAVFDACGGTLLACDDNSCGIKGSVEINPTPGATYLIRVAGANDSFGTFRFELTDVAPPEDIGPDVIVGALPSTRYWGQVGGINGYSVATTSCNVGDEILAWTSGTVDHPVIGQHMYRLKDGRFEMIGQSWLKHAFATVNNNICGTCTGPTGQQLYPGCSDPYGTFLNGEQGNLGPKFEVNATTGAYLPNFFAQGQTGNAIYKRLQVDRNDIDVNPTDTLYFVESQYVTADDAAANNGRNNASYQQIRFSSLNANPSNVGPTVREKAGIEAWKDFDPDVEITFVDYVESTVMARYIVGAKATDNGDGTWSYEYAVFNLNSHRSADMISIPVGTSTTVSNIGFHDVEYHSGEPYDNTDWSGIKQTNEVIWTSPADFATDPNTNALRWGTMYNYRFIADAPPTTGDMTIGLFRPDGAGTPDQLVASTIVPSVVQTCAADWNSDGFLNDTDFFDWVNDYFSQTGPRGEFDFNDDSFENAQDWFDFINAFFNPGPGC